MVVADGEFLAEALLKIFYKRIHNHDTDNAPEESDVDEYRGSDKDNEKGKLKTGSVKHATARNATVGITADWYDALAFLQGLSLKALQVIVAPLLVWADKRTTICLLQW